MRNLTIFFILVLASLYCAPGQAEVLKADTTWHGDVDLREDILILPGVTLTIAAGTNIKVWPSDSTKIDPEYLSRRTEILVRGKLVGQGRAAEKIIFSAAKGQENERWAGIIIDNGTVALSHCLIKDAETAINVIAGDLELEKSVIRANRYGIIGQSSAASLNLVDSSITANDYGLSAYDNPKIVRRRLLVFDNLKDDYLDNKSASVAVKPIVYRAPDSVPLTRTYENEALVGVTIWKGRILISGQLRLSPDARLIILPGTVVEFSMRDTNGDGIGENGLQIQGHIVAKGTPEKPIIFRAVARDKKMGAWDGINILGSDLAQNIIEYCQIEDSYRGVHFHFANVAVNHCIFRNNYRGAQFQESLVTVTNCQFFYNKSAMQARDSQVVLNDNEIFANINGANLFRFNLKARYNTFGPNLWDGLRLREGTTEVINNRMLSNRTGLLVANAVYGVFKGNIIAANLETGLGLLNSDNIEVRGNVIEYNGLNGISLRDTRAEIADNLIAENGQRGLGIVSFTGVIENNNIIGNKHYGIGLEGPGDIIARGNFWGESDLGKEIYDGADEVGLGKVQYLPQLAAPVVFTWPLAEIKTDLLWTGAIYVPQTITVPIGADLTVRPASTVFFGKGVDLNVFGNMRAIGQENKRITFTSKAQTGPSDWGQITVENSDDTFFSYCDFTYADWGLHLHYVPVQISFCRFMDSDGGMRFRSGPIEITNCLFTRNRIGARSFRGIVDINHSVFHGNEIGIFVREGGSGVKINYNNLFDNERYNLRLGDFDKENVKAANNWWGRLDPQETIFDGHNETYIGMVEFNPVLKAPQVMEEIK